MSGHPEAAPDRGLTNWHTGSDSFPLVDRELLLGLPKAGKSQDMRRILNSPGSEDWVTWNVMRLIQARADGSWWPEMAELAQTHAPGLHATLAAGAVPAIDLWRVVPSPPQYERASRRRMAASANAAWRRRATKPNPVEGDTEVDCVLEGADFLVYVEAKLHSDVSPRTTYDPARNQIVRNIDCVIEEAGSRRPYFWLIVRDRLPAFQYAQLVDGYRNEQGRLAKALPHRDPVLLSAIIDALAIIEWREILPLIPRTSESAQVLAELHRRVD